MADIQIPPYPLTVNEAKRQANDLAYGFEKHTDDYWDKLYAQDQEYAWKRMLGWQSEGGDDEAKFGFYAVPPSPWHGTPVDPPVPVPVPDPPPVPDDRLAALEKQIAVLTEAVLELAAKPAPDYKGETDVRILGHISLTLKPQ